MTFLEAGRYVFEGLVLTLVIGAGGIVLAAFFAWMLYLVEKLGSLGKSLSFGMMLGILAMPGIWFFIMIYYGLSSLGVQLSAIPASCIAVGIINSGNLKEAAQAGFRSIPYTQREAGLALGLTPLQLFVLVEVPQAWHTTRPLLFVLLNNIFKDTSLAFVLSVPEIMYRSYNIAAQSYQSFMAFTLAGLGYCSIGLPLLLMARRTTRTSSSHRQQAREF